MKKLFLALFILVMATKAYGQATTPLPLPADRILTGDIINTSCPGDVTAGGCIVINTQGTSTISIIISGGWSSPTSFITFEATPSDSGGWITLPLVNASSLVNNSLTSMNGYWFGGVGGYRKFRVRLIGTFNSAAHVVLNAAAGQPPKVELNREFDIYKVLLSASNSVGLTYAVDGCETFKNVQLSVLATGENTMTASIETSNTPVGPWANYKQFPIGYNVPSIYNGQISAPFFHILIPYDGTTAGDITISGGCKQ